MQKIPPEINKLILSIYQGVEEESPWASFCEAFSEVSGYRALSLIVRRPSSLDHGFIVHRGGALEWINRYEDYFYRVDPFNTIPSGKAISMIEYLPAEEFAANEFNQGFLTPLDIVDVLGVDSEQASTDSGKIQLRVCRNKEEVPFSKGFKRFVDSLFPHLVIAARLHRSRVEHQTAGQLIEQVLNNLNVAMLVVTGSLRIMSINSQGRRLLYDEETFMDQDGSLVLKGQESQTKLESAVKAITDGYQDDFPTAVQGFTVTGSGGIQYSLVLKPTPQPKDVSHVAASLTLMISSAEHRAQMDENILKEVYGFTDAEVGLAILLAKGLSASEAAAALSVSINTVRSHLRALLGKTGVGRQSDLLWMFWQAAL